MFVSSFVSIWQRILPARTLEGEGNKWCNVASLIPNDKTDCQLFISLFFFLDGFLFDAFLSKHRGVGQHELCSWQQLRFWHHLPPNPLPRKGLTSVYMCVHMYAPHVAIHHFSRFTLTGLRAPFLSQESAFDTTTFLSPALDFSDAVWHIVVGGRGRGFWVETGEDFFRIFLRNPLCFSTYSGSLRCWTFSCFGFLGLFFTFPGSYECGMHGFLLQKQQETEQV